MIDVSGRADCVKSFMTSASEAQNAVLFVSATDLFEETCAAANKDLGVPEGQSRLHSRLVNFMA